MKNILLVFALAAYYPYYSQNLTISDLLTIRQKSIISAEEFLSAKNWDLINSHSNNGVLSLQFSYKKSVLSDLAESFLTLHSNDFNNDFNKVVIQINNNAKYNDYISSIKKIATNTSSANVVDGKLVKIYKNKNFTFIIWSGNSENFFKSLTPIWHIEILKNEDTNSAEFIKIDVKILDELSDAYYEKFRDVVDEKELKSQLNFISSDNTFNYFVQYLGNIWDEKNSQHINTMIVKMLNNNNNSYKLINLTIYDGDEMFYKINSIKSFDRNGSAITNGITKIPNLIMLDIHFFVGMNCSDCSG